MTTESTGVRHFTRAELMPLAPGVEAFLERLGGPSWISVAGRDRRRCRVLVTLLHGNEPSGVIALHRWLGSGEQPAVDVHCFVASVEAALTAPRFTHRMLPGRADLNRCFKPPFEGTQGAIAQSCLNRLEQLEPEAVVDIHNTSGDGPAFGVTAYDKPALSTLVACFTHRLVITDLRMGALLEAARDDLHIVTIEVGGSQEPASHETAYDGLRRFVTIPDLYAADLATELFEVLKHPLRLELASDATLTYNDHPQEKFDVTISADIEQHNFGTVTPGIRLGWLGATGLSGLRVPDGNGGNLVSCYFTADAANLRPRVPLKVFMATPNPELAAGDCLFYFVPADPGA